jgi:hypothetical protein
MSEVPSFVGTEFDIFAPKPIHSRVDQTIDTIYKPVASVDQSDLEFAIPGDSDTYLDLDIKLFVKGKLVKPEGTALDNTDFTAGTNDLLNSVFSQCSITLNGTHLTRAAELYNYRAYIETLLTYGTDADASHLTNAYWYIDGPEMPACGPTADDARTKGNAGFADRWNRMKQSNRIKLYRRIHADICNVRLYLLSNIRLQIKFTKARTNFFLINKDNDTKVEFKFLDAHLFVKRIRPNPAILAAHNQTLSKGILTRYNFTRVELKTFTFSSGSQSLSIDNTVLGTIPKRLIFTMIKNTDFLGTMHTNPYNFQQ